MSRIEELEAELVVLKAEAAFREKKADGTLTREDKIALRELRQEYRENDRPVKEGAQPAAIGASAQVEEV